jgi:Predicted membrane protein (DUF2335).
MPEYMNKVPSLLDGVASVIDVFGNYPDYNNRHDFSETDDIKILQEDAIRANKLVLGMSGTESKLPKNRNDSRAIRQGNNGGMIATMRASLLPPPDGLERYEKLYPGVTKALVDAYVKQTDHRIDVEKQIVSANTKRMLRGQILGFIISLGVLGISTLLLLKGRDVQGFTALVIAMGGLVMSFITGTYRSNKRDEDK